MSVRISILICITSATAYWHLHNTLTDKTKRQLADYIAQRGVRESQRFQLAESNLTRMAKELRVVLAAPGTDGLATWERVSEARPDGTARQRTGADYERTPTMYYGAQTPLTDELRNRLGRVYDFAQRFGVAYWDQFADVHITVPENGIVMFWPGQNYGHGAPSDYDMRKEEFISIAAPENNPRRGIAWTGMYFERAVNKWMVSAEIPVDVDGKWVATIGHDVLLTELMQGVMQDHLPGASNVVFREDGRLIAHADADRSAQILKSDGKLAMQDIDASSRQTYELVVGATRAHDSTIIDDEQSGNLLAVHRIAGPNWLLVVRYPRSLISSEALRAAQFVLLLGVFSLLAELGVLFFVMRSKIAAPLKLLMQGTENLAAGKLDAKIELASNDEFGQLASSFNGMTRAIAERDARLAEHAASLERRVEERTNQLDERNRAMRLVLDTVRDGLVIVDVHGEMSSERSAVMERWFGAVGSATSFADYVERHDPTFATWLTLGLECLRSDFMPIELCIDQLPSRIQVARFTLDVTYEPVLVSGRVERLLVALTDVTAERERERTQAEQADLLRVLERVEADRRGFLQFLDEQERIVHELTEQPLGDPAVTARLIHTLKGNSSLFGVATIARLCHDIEERMNTGSSFEGPDRDLLAATWKTTAARIRKILGNRADTTIEVSRKDYEQTLSLMRALETRPEVVRSVQEWDLDPVHARLERLGENAASLAERLGKPELKIECDGGGLRLESDRWASLWSACVHLVRNAVDHGIELPDERAARGKRGGGRLVLQAAVESEELVLAFEDDGAGIDWPRLEQKAIARGLPFANEADRVAVLFADGLSSRDEASEVSGRGVGMGAVRDEVRARGGSIRVNSTPGLGTRIELRCPVHGCN